MIELPWNEKVPLFAIHPDAATRKDITKLAEALMDANHDLTTLRAALRELAEKWAKMTDPSNFNIQLHDLDRAHAMSQCAAELRRVIHNTEVTP